MPLSTVATRRSITQKPERFPVVAAAKHWVWLLRTSLRNKTRFDVVSTFPLYAPCSGGDYKDLAALTVRSINQVFPLLCSLASTLHPTKPVRIVKLEDFPSSNEEAAAGRELRLLFDKHGSDKGRHNFYHVYGAILRDKASITGVLEIGLGTNNTDVVSNMGADGTPGASLRAFRDFLPNAAIYGADVDRRVLFTEERIATYWVDQTEPGSLAELSRVIPNELDLIIDDGLHAPNANLATLKFAIGKIKIGGWVIIEDISADAFHVWELVATLMPPQYEPYLFKTRTAFSFGVRRSR